MASVSASHLILFIASVLVAASVAGTITTTVGRLSDGVSQQGDALSQDVRTDIEIISDSGAPVYDRDGNGNLSLLVKNTGSRSLVPLASQMDVIVDGQLEQSVNVTVVDGASPNSWQPGDVIRVDISVPSLETGDHRVQITANGDKEVFRFNT